MSKRIVLIGGGTGLSNLARGLRRILRRYKITDTEITAVVSMADSGGFSGWLRNEKGMLPPGDINKNLLALSTLREVAHRLYYKRLEDGTVPGHFMLLGMVESYGWLRAIANMQELLECSGNVLPVTLDSAHLFAETNRRIIAGEGRIEDWFYGHETGDDDEKLQRVYLEPDCSLLSEAKAAIEVADLVVIGPGSFYTSLIACLQVKGMNEALAQKRLAFVVNVTTHLKETPEWRVSDFIGRLENQIGRKVDIAVCNENVSEDLLETYEHKGQDPVEIDVDDIWNGRQIIKRQLVRKHGRYARHSPYMLARVILDLLE